MEDLEHPKNGSGVRLSGWLSSNMLAFNQRGLNWAPLGPNKNRALVSGQAVIPAIPDFGMQHADQRCGKDHGIAKR